ncbi:MAG: ABC transporter permease subunit [Thermomicrobiales bacterium]|nr:ABC transporter permease subunit [Thermomicrobiales bacterium]
MSGSRPIDLPAGVTIPEGAGGSSSWKTVRTVLQHAYIWIWLVIFVIPFLATLVYSFESPKGGYSLEAYDFVKGAFLENLVYSLELTLMAIIGNLLISIPAAYAIVRHNVPGKRLILSTLNVSLYAPAAVMGLSLLITYAYLLDFMPLTHSTWGLLAAYVVGTFPLMLLPIIVALRDMPMVYQEAAHTLGASRAQSLFRIELPLLGPGIGAGILMTFVIVFNEFLVTLFIAGPENQTAALRVYGLTRTAGFSQSTAAAAATMQLVSFVVVLVFFKLVGSRYLKGTYFA